MLRRRLVPCYPYAGWAYGPSSMQEPRRGLKTLDVREYRPLGTPIEFRFYQRYANHPNRQSGVQFLTHYDTHQRFRVKKDFIDYLHWGQEQGQARLPHRHQRVAHDFHEQLHPTLVHQRPRFAGQDPTMAPHADISTSFDPNKRVFSDPEHWNKMFSHRRPGEGDIRLNATDSMSLLGPLVTQTDVQEARFHRETRGPTHGRVPGINAEFRGEFDHQMMQAMSRPLNRTHTLTGNDGRFSNTIYINDPNRHQVLSSSLAKDLQTCIDRATNGVYSKLTVVEAAQSGCTDYFCGGVDMAQLGHDISMANLLRERAAAKLASSSTTAQDAPKSVEKDVAVLLRDANRHIDRADEMLREHAALIYRTYTAARPLMTLVNGKCRGSGCGLALASKFPALKDSSEFIFDGPNTGVTPFGGLTRLLARPETSLKMPGVAEFVMLTGASLFAGDALRLGWTDLYTSLEDVSYHIKDWFNQSEHMHNDAVAWQLGHLLDSAFRMKEAHSSAVERTAITPLRARWIEDIFADQPSVEDIMASLSEVEKLPLTDAHNQCEELHYATTPFTISSVAEAVAKLDASQLRYTLSPWDRSAPVEEVAVRQAADIFTSYVLQRHGDVQVVVHGDEAKLRRWQAQREEEYHRYTEMRAAPHARHVYVKMEGCEGRLIDFDFVFEPSRSGEDQALPELKRRVLAALNMPVTREVELGWYLPTLDTCPIQSDRDVAEMLHADPSIEDPRAELKYPPIYLIVKRQSLYFSEWAYAVKHQLLLQSPYALKASLGLLHEVRGDGSAEQIPSLSDSLEMEFRYLVRSMKRPDFYAVGQHTNHSPEEWNAIKEDRERNIHLSHLPTRPLPDYDAVFERNVVLDGHSFALRPRWSPRTLAEVPSDEVAKLRTPITYDDDHTAALDTSIYCSKSERLDGMLEDAGGVEVVAGLGETTEDGKPRVEPWTSNAVVPNNVSFYDMARHPFEDSASSWRRDGFTEGSKAFYEQQYRAAEKAVYDEEGRGIHSYYPTTSAADGTGAGEESNAMLEERLMREVKRAESGVENWARDLRTKAMQGKLDDRVTIATQQEKIYDDEYYRWFIQPGHHPNPSGLRMGKRQTSKKASEEEADLNAFLKNLMDGAASEKRMTEELHEAEELVSAAAVEEMTEDTH